MCHEKRDTNRSARSKTSTVLRFVSRYSAGTVTLTSHTQGRIRLSVQTPLRGRVRAVVSCQRLK